MITERLRAPRRTKVFCGKCRKAVLLEPIDILIMGGVPEKAWHNECLNLPKHNSRCLETCSCKKGKMVYDRTHDKYDQTNGYKNTKMYKDSMVVEEIRGSVVETLSAPEVPEISTLAESTEITEKESTASNEVGGTTTHNDPKARRIASQKRLCIKCNKEIIYPKRRGRPPVLCGNCKSGVTP